jgi:hypothetical protein
MQKLTQVANVSGKAAAKDIVDPAVADDPPAQALPPLIPASKNTKAFETKLLGDAKQSTPGDADNRNKLGSQPKMDRSPGSLINDEREPMLDNLANTKEPSVTPGKYVSKSETTNSMGQFELGFDPTSKNSQVARIRPAFPGELDTIKTFGGYQNPRENRNCMKSEEKTQKDWSQVPTKELLNMLLPSSREVKSCGYQNDYARHLKDLSRSDSFVNPRLTDYYREAAKRMPEHLLEEILELPQTAEGLIEDCVDSMEISKTLDLLASTDLRSEVSSLLLELPPEMFTKAITSVDLEVDNCEMFISLSNRQRSHHLLPKLARSCKDELLAIFLSPDFADSFEKTLAFGSSEGLIEALTLANLPLFFSRSPDKVAAILVKYKLEDHRDEIEALLTSDPVNSKLYALLQKVPPDSTVSELEKQLGVRLEMPGNKLIAVISHCFFHLISTLTIEAIQESLKLDSENLIAATLLLKNAPEDWLAANVLARFSKKSLTAFYLENQSINDLFFVVASLDEEKFRNILSRVPDADLKKLAKSVLSINHFRDQIIDHFIQNKEPHSRNHHQTQGWCWKKKQSNKRSTFLALEKVDEKIEDNIDSDKLETLIEPDASLLENFWLQGDPQDGLAMWPHLNFKGDFTFSCNILEGTDFTVFLSAGKTLKAVIFDSRTCKILANLPGVYLAYVDTWKVYTSVLITLRFAACPTYSDGKGVIRKEIVIYDLKKLPELIQLEIFPLEPIQIDSKGEELGIATDYTGACQAKNSRIDIVGDSYKEKLVYFNWKGNFRVLVEQRVLYRYVFSEHKGTFSLPEAFEWSPGYSSIYLYDHCSKLAIADREHLQVSIFDVAINIEAQAASITAHLYNKISLADLGMGSCRYELLARDPYLMAQRRSPLHILLKKSIAEISVNRREGSLKELFKADDNESISSFGYCGELFLVLVKNVKTNKSCLVICQSEAEGLPMKEMARIDANYSYLSFSGNMVFMMQVDKHKSQASSFKFQQKKLNCQTVAYEQSNNFNLGISPTRYGFISMDISMNKKVVVRNFRDNSVVHDFDFKELKALYEHPSLALSSPVFNADLTHVVLVTENPTMFFCLDLQAKKFCRIDIDLTDINILLSCQSFIAVTWQKKAQIYYLDQAGRLSLVDSLVTEEKLGVVYLNSSYGVWHFRSRQMGEKLGAVGYKNKIIDKGLHLHGFELAQGTEFPSAIALYSNEEILLYDLKKDDLQQTPRRVKFSNIKKVCIDSSGELCYVIAFDTSLCLFRLSLIDVEVSTKKIQSLGITDSRELEVCLNYDESHILVKYDSDREGSGVKVFDARHCICLYYLSKECLDLPYKSSLKHAQFDEDHCSMVNLHGFGDSLIKISNINPNPFKSDEARLSFGLIMEGFLKNHHEFLMPISESLSELDSFIRSFNPFHLVREKAIFVILANYKNPEILQLYIDHCTLKKMVLYGHLVEWLFTNFNQGKWLRKHVLSNIEESFAVSQGIDNLDNRLFEKIVMYKHTAKMLAEPAGRGIFMNLLRVPLFEDSSGDREPVYLEIADRELDRDYDTGFNIDLGSIQRYLERSLNNKINQIKKKLHRLVGDNLIPYQVAISSTPIDLTIGSKFTTELFKLLDNCPSEELDDLLRPIIYLYWRMIYPLAFSYMAAYWAFASMCYAFYGFLYKNVGLGAAIIAMSCLFLVYELLTLRSQGKRYLRSPWNSVDILSLLGCIVTIPMMWSFNVETQGWAVGRCAILTVVWLRALTWLKIFRSIRYLITMVLRVFYDMIAYLVVLTGSVFGLAFLWRLSFYFPPDGDDLVVGRESRDQIPSFFSSLQTVTMIILGNMPGAEADGREFSVVRFLVAVAFGIILALALINLLIAIISTTYEEIESTKKLHDLREVTGLIVDFNGAATGWFACASCQRRHHVLSIHKSAEAAPNVG